MAGHVVLVLDLDQVAGELGDGADRYSTRGGKLKLHSFKHDQNPTYRATQSCYAYIFTEK